MRKTRRCLSIIIIEKVCVYTNKWIDGETEGLVVRICQDFHCIGISKKLTLPASCYSESYTKVKMNLNFYFWVSLLGLKRFQKTFWDTAKKFEDKNIFGFTSLSGIRMERVAISDTAWKVSKYGVFLVNILTRKNSIFGHFSHSGKFWIYYFNLIF